MRREAQLLLTEELSIKALTIECTHKVKAYGKEQTKQEINAKNSSLQADLFQGQQVIEGFIWETLALRKYLWGKVKALRKENKIVYLNCKTIFALDRNDSQV